MDLVVDAPVSFLRLLLFSNLESNIQSLVKIGSVLLLLFVFLVVAVVVVIDNIIVVDARSYFKVWSKSSQ